MNYRNGFFGLLAITVATHAWLAYALLDRSVRIDHSQQSYRTLRADFDVVRIALMNTWVHQPRAAIERELRKRFAGHIIKNEGDMLVVDGVGFYFEGERLERIVLLSDPSDAMDP